MTERRRLPGGAGDAGGAPHALYYCHDKVGLGHVRRTLTIAAELERRRPDVGQVVVSGASHLTAFELPSTLDHVKLPSPAKAALYDGQGRTAALDGDTRAVQRVRGAVIQAVARSFAPSLFLVDNVPAGWGRELLRTLGALREAVPRVALVLGLRDIVDDPASVVDRWRQLGVYDLLERTYDRILVYGSRDVFDPITEYRFPPAAAAKTVFCGYVKQFEVRIPSAEVRARLAVGTAPLVVVTVGGGGGADGTVLLRRYLAALHRPELDGVRSFVVTGPNVEPEVLPELEAAARLPGVTLVRFAEEMQSYLNAADLVVCLGGYNTSCEVVGLGKRALVVPRADYFEQRQRAARFAELGLVTALDPDGLTPERLARAVRDGLDVPPPRGEIDFGGLARVGEVLAGALASVPAPAPAARHPSPPQAAPLPSAAPGASVAAMGVRPRAAAPRLALVADRFPESAAPFLVDQVVGLLGRGWDVRVVCRRSDQAEWDRFPELRGGGEMRARVLAATAVRGELRKLEPDLVHFASGRLAGVWPRIKADLGCQVIVSVGGAEDDSGLAGAHASGEERGWDLVDAVHAVGRGGLRRAEELGCPPGTARAVIPPGVDVAALDPCDGRLDGVLGSPERPLRVLGVGPIDWTHGYEYAAQALRGLVDSGVRCEYRVVGDGGGRDALVHLVHDLGLTEVVRFMGDLTRAEVREQLQWADALLHAAVADAFPVVLLEAQAMELPVVCAAADGLAEEAVGAEVGFVVPRRDPAALADRLAALAHQPERRRRMGQAGRRRVEARFQLDDQIARFDAFYREVLGREAGAAPAVLDDAGRRVETTVERLDAPDHGHPNGRVAGGVQPEPAELSRSR